MKKIELVLLVIVSIWFVSCGERYEEEKGLVFEGTWTLLESYIGAEKVPIHRAKFFTARKLAGENLLLFYSGGRYDSSFVYRFQNNNLYVNRVLDSVQIIEYYLLSDSGDTIKSPSSNYPIIYRANIGLINYPNSIDQWKSIEEKFKNSGKKCQIIDTIIEVQKPEYPHIGNYSEEKYYGTRSFAEGTSTLTIERYYVDSNGAPTGELYGRDIYERPVDKE
jgi:hypothetical protein